MSDKGENRPFQHGSGSSTRDRETRQNSCRDMDRDKRRKSRSRSREGSEDKNNRRRRDRSRSRDRSRVRDTRDGRRRERSYSRERERRSRNRSGSRGRDRRRRDQSRSREKERPTGSERGSLRDKDGPEQAPPHSEPKSTQTDVTAIDIQATMKAALERAQALAAGAPKPVPTMPIAGVSMANQIQEQKKKMLWGAKKQEKAAAESFNQWEATAFNDDDGGAKRAKFLKLMGAAKGAGPVPPAPAQGQAGPAPRADAALSEIERQFEESRQRQYALGGGSLGLGIH